MKRVLLVACMLLGFAVTAHDVEADTGNGATVLRVSRCEDFYGYTVCFSFQGETNQIFTPSDNLSGEGRSITTFTASYQGQIIDSEVYVSQFHVLYQDAQLQEARYFDRFCLSFYGQGYGVVAAFHYAHGMVQYAGLTVTEGC